MRIEPATRKKNRRSTELLLLQSVHRTHSRMIHHAFKGDWGRCHQQAKRFVGGHKHCLPEISGSRYNHFKYNLPHPMPHCFPPQRHLFIEHCAHFSLDFLLLFTIFALPYFGVLRYTVTSEREAGQYTNAKNKRKGETICLTVTRQKLMLLRSQSVIGTLFCLNCLYCNQTYYFFLQGFIRRHSKAVSRNSHKFVVTHTCFVLCLCNKQLVWKRIGIFYFLI